MFHEAHGYLWWAWVVGTLVVSGVVIALMQLLPVSFRRPLILTITFLGGLYFALEFFLPTHPIPTAENPDAVGNFLTPYIVPFGSVAQVIAAWTAGLGVINLCQVHGKRIISNRTGMGNSIAFFVSMLLMLVVGLVQKVQPKSGYKVVYDLLFEGGLANLDATVFSIVAFYIVSAAYRAFRVRSAEATILLLTAVVVMLGQVAVGQWLMHALPRQGPLQVLHFEIVRNWILTIVNAAATRAIAFGLSVGGLAVALRIWLGLERGSYFE